jgi:hypothetical protein
MDFDPRIGASRSRSGNYNKNQVKQEMYGEMHWNTKGDCFILYAESNPNLRTQERRTKESHARHCQNRIQWEPQWQLQQVVIQARNERGNALEYERRLFHFI